MSTKPNILIIMADGWRRQAVGCMNHDPVLTPRMDAFAAQSCVMERAYSNHPLCTPARATFLTGRYAQEIGMEYNWQRLPVDEPTLSQVAADNGYDTALIGKWHLDDYEPTDKHGDHWTTLTPPGERRMGFRYWYCNGCCHDHWKLRYNTTEDNLFEGEGWQLTHETDVCLDYFKNEHGERPKDKPWLMCLNWSPPHNECGRACKDEFKGQKQYYAPEEFEAQYHNQDIAMKNPHTDAEAYQRWAPGYFGAISSMDHEFGRIYDYLSETGQLENTIIVLTADHGEMLGTHGRWTKDVWYEESAGIPFIIGWPGHIPAGSNKQLMSLVDAFPSLAHIAGLPIPEGRTGTNYGPQILQEQTTTDDHVYLSHNTGAPPPERTRYDFPIEKGMYWRGVVTSRYTYAIVDQRPESIFYDDENTFDRFPDNAKAVLFDLDNDPHQQHAIYPGADPRYDDIIESLHQDLAKHLDRIGDDFINKYWQQERHEHRQPT